MLRLAEGVILNLIIITSPFLPIILLRVTPTANRNSYRVARLVVQLPRVAVFARNPGLGKRNSYRVAAAYGLPVYSCFCTGDSRTFSTASDTFFLPFRLTMSIIMRTFAPIYIIRYGKTE